MVVFALEVHCGLWALHLAPGMGVFIGWWDALQLVQPYCQLSHGGPEFVSNCLFAVV